MIYNKITLAFPENEEKLFLKQYYLDSLKQVRFSFILVSFLYGFFGILDTLMYPELAYNFHVIRYFIVIPIFSLTFLLSFTKVFIKIWQAMLFISLLAGGFGISLMIFYLPENYFYISGMMLIFSAGYFFIKLRFFLATLGSWLVLLFYNLGAIFFTNSPEILIINTNFFFISANIIGMFAAYYIEYYSRRNYFLNKELDIEKSLVESINQNLGKTVEERTRQLLLANEAAEVTNANITAIIEGTTNSVWAFDRNYKILYVNKVFQQEFLQTFGVNLDLGVNLIEALPEDLRPVWQPRYDRVMANEQFTLEDAVETPNGTIYIQIHFTPIIKQGEVVGGSCFGDNITPRKNAEKELIRAKEQAVESDRLKSAFLANMSHEIRTPMNGILGFTEILKEPGLSGEKQKEYIHIIEKSGVRMLSIINDIVDISKIEAGMMKVDIKASNVNEQIEYVYSFFVPEVESRGLKLKYNNSLSSERAIIKTDSEKLYAILINLIKNAIKYTEKGSIEFGYDIVGEKDARFIQFYVKDSGIGIPGERHKSIFERFIQADLADKMARQGAGLGLTITKAYVEMLGGEIRVESEENKGSIFYFTLPYNPENEDKTVFENQVPETKEHYLNSLKVLIAEDDDTSEKLITIIVKEFSKEILKARTGFEALEICRNNPDIDLILLDVQMPVMNGHEAARQIRQFNKDVIIIAQTAFGLSGDRDKALEVGCNDYIAKPIKKDALLLLIQKHFTK